jgi:hypothetical protein
MAPFLPSITAFTWKTPFGWRLISSCFTGPCSPRGSLYWKPVVPVAVQKGLPDALVPCASAKVWVLGAVPFSCSSSRAPPALPATVGSPTRVFGDDVSFAVPTILRLALAPVGFFTVRTEPRMAWSAAPDMPDTSNRMPTLSAIVFMSPPMHAQMPVPEEAVPPGSTDCQGEPDA